MSEYRTGCIYLLTNRVNGKQYVGQSVKGAVSRFREHVKCAVNGGNAVLYRAMRKWGAHNFRVRVLKTATEPLLDGLERYYIARRATLLPQGYNATKGGDGGGYGRLPKHRRKAIGAKITAATAGRRPEIMRRHFESPAGAVTKRLISAKLTGKKLSEEVCRNHSAGLHRRYARQEERDKTVQASLRHYQSAEGVATRAAQSAASQRRAASGAYFSEATKQRLRDLARAQWAARKAAGYARLSL
jgi:group I intron endonuclease